MRYRQIEFYGLPASGKSTLMRALHEELNKTGIQVHTRCDIKRKALYKEWLSWRGICYSIGCFFIWWGKDKKEREDFKFWKGMCGKFAALKAMSLQWGDNEVVLVDHGRVQGLSSLLNKSCCKEKDFIWFLSELDKNFKNQVLYIYLYVNEEDCYERMKSRGKQVRLLYYDKNSALSYMKNMNHMYEKIYCYMKEKGCGLKIDSSESIELCLKKLLIELKDKGNV